MTRRTHTLSTLSLYWGSIGLGLTLPWIIQLGVEIMVHRIPVGEAWRSFRLHLFAPGYNYFLIGVLNGVPFLIFIFALFALFHLGGAPSEDRFVTVRRALGLAAAALLLVDVSLWTHITLLLYPDAQGPIAYLFLPVALMVTMVVGYAVGRLLGKFVLMPKAVGS